MLRELPAGFMQPGGESFLNACFDRHGRQWTGLHLRMEQLFALGIAIGKANYTSLRETWARMPGGMPYVVAR